VDAKLNIVFGPAPKGTLTIGHDLSDADTQPGTDDLPNAEPAIQLHIDLPLGRRKNKSRRV